MPTIAALAAGDLGIDFSFARPRPTDTVKAGGRLSIRYSAGVASRSSHPSYRANRGKLITPKEFKGLLDSGQDLAANSEWYTTRVTEGAAAGKADAQADAELWHACGLAKGASIYVSWDAAPVRSKWNAVDEYLHAYEENLEGQYHADCYAGSPFLKWALARHRIRYGWRPNAGSWSGDGLPYQPTTHTRAQRAELVAFAAHRTPAALWQTGNYWFSKGADEIMILRPDIGSHRQALAASLKPTPKPPTPKPPLPAYYHHDGHGAECVVTPDGQSAWWPTNDGKWTLRKYDPKVKHGTVRRTL